MFLIRVSTLLVFVLVLAVCAGCSRPPEQQVILLHTGRLMGNVYPAGSGLAASLQHYPYLAGYVEQVRREAAGTGAQVVLIDSGDSLGGSFASHATGGRIMAAFFSELGYDALFLGNLDAGLSPDFIRSLGIPVLCPFVRPDGTTAVPGTVTSLRLVKGDISVVFRANYYGDTDPGAHPDRFPSRFGGEAGPVLPDRSAPDWAPVERDALRIFHWMRFEPSHRATRPFLERLHAGGTDLVVAHRILPSHEQETWKRQEGVEAWPLPVSENILRQNKGFTIARTDLRRSGTSWRVTRSELVQMTANSAPASERIQAVLAPFAEPIQRADRVLGALDRAWNTEEILLLYMGSLAGIGGAESVLYSPQSIRAEWARGDLTASMVYETLPWDNDLLVLETDRETYQKLAAMPAIHRLEQRTGRSPVRFVTSAYFADIFQRVGGDRIRMVSSVQEGGEYERFCRYLKAHPDALRRGCPPGWTHEKPR
jgi:hypothetical protein